MNRLEQEKSNLRNHLNNYLTDILLLAKDSGDVAILLFCISNVNGAVPPYMLNREGVSELLAAAGKYFPHYYTARPDLIEELDEYVKEYVDKWITIFSMEGEVNESLATNILAFIKNDDDGCVRLSLELRELTPDDLLGFAEICPNNRLGYFVNIMSYMARAMRHYSQHHYLASYLVGLRTRMHRMISQERQIGLITRIFQPSVTQSPLALKIVSLQERLDASEKYIGDFNLVRLCLNIEYTDQNMANMPYLLRYLNCDFIADLIHQGVITENDLLRLVRSVGLTATSNTLHEINKDKLELARPYFWLLQRVAEVEMCDNRSPETMMPKLLMILENIDSSHLKKIADIKITFTPLLQAEDFLPEREHDLAAKINRFIDLLSQLWQLNDARILILQDKISALDVYSALAHDDPMNHMSQRYHLFLPKPQPVVAIDGSLTSGCSVVMPKAISLSGHSIN